MRTRGILRRAQWAGVAATAEPLIGRVLVAQYGEDAVRLDVHQAGAQYDGRLEWSQVRALLAHLLQVLASPHQ